MWTPPAHSPVRPLQILRAIPAGRPAVERLERYLEERFDSPRAIGTGSGTEALQLALEMALVHVPEHARIVALPAYGCPDLLSAADGAAAAVIFYDLRLDDLGPDPAALREAARRAGVLVVANIYGFPLDWPTIRKIAKEEGCLVVEDAAQGIGSRWQGIRGGTGGHLTVLSFGRGKGWTGGGGGALLAREEALLDHPLRLSAASASALGMALNTGAYWLLSRPSLYGLAVHMPGLRLGETFFRPPRPPRRIHPFTAALVWASRKDACQAVGDRRERAALLRHALSDLDIRMPAPPRGSVSAELRLPLLLPQPEEGAGLNRAGVYRGYPQTLNRFEAASRLAVEDGSPHPGADLLARSLVTAPTHARARPAEVYRALARALESSRRAGAEPAVAFPSR